MNQIAVVYWSGTGNTEAMANLIADGAKAAGAAVDIFQASEFDAAKIAGYEALAFGCPAMGDEELEEDEFLPMWESVKDSLDGKRVALFGSYGWGDGDWLQNWKDGAPCGIFDILMCNEAPDDEGETACRDLGTRLAE